MNLRIVSVFLFVITANTTAHAQSGRPRGSAALTGVVRDSVSGRPPARSSICAYIPVAPSAYEARCAAIDSFGHYRLEHVPPLRLVVQVSCERIRGWGLQLGKDSVAFVDSVTLRRDWIVRGAGCDPRPVRRIAGVFRGHYTPGFESSDFVPCSADAWIIPGDSLVASVFGTGHAWVTWPHDAGDNLKWPDATRDSFGDKRYYVRWRGTIVGPGHYGHMGAAPFELVVDTVLALRAPTAKDCR